MMVWEGGLGGWFGMMSYWESSTTQELTVGPTGGFEPAALKQVDGAFGRLLHTSCEVFQHERQPGPA